MFNFIINLIFKSSGSKTKINLSTKWFQFSHERETTPAEFSLNIDAITEVFKNSDDDNQNTTSLYIYFNHAINV